jgi:hypothetical protein
VAISHTVPTTRQHTITHTFKEWRNEGNACLRTRHRLLESEQEGQVAVDAFPRAGDLDEDTLLLDADGVVEGDELLGLGGLLVERESGVDLGGDTAGDDL